MKLRNILILAVFLIFPTIVYAKDIDYDITNYYINSNILENGDLEVSELIVMDGTFNGYEREIAFKNSNLSSYEELNFEHNMIYNAKNIKDYECYAKYVDSVSFDTFSEDFIKLNQIYNAYDAKKGDVYITQNTDSITFRMYYRSDNRKVAFFIKYIVESPVVVHNDVSELYWTFMGENFTDDIKDLKIRVNLPSIDESSNFRVWAHGDLTGEIHKYEDKYVLATMDKLYANSSVDIRMTFDTNLINNDSNLTHTYVDALDEIVKVETKRADIANEQRKKAKIYVNIFRIIASLILILQIISIIYIYIKYDKEYKSEFNNDYYRDFIDDYNVEVVEYVVNKSITSNAMSASIMNMIYKKNISTEKITSEKKDEYKFTLNNTDNLNNDEQRLVEFLFKTVGSNNIFTTKELKKYASSTKTYDKFLKSYTNWKNAVINTSKSLNFYENHGKVLAYSIIMFIVISLFGCTTLNLVGSDSIVNILNVFNIFLSVIILVYSCTFKKRTKVGNEHYVKWKAFKKFLLDFGTFSDKELPEIILWERYLVYATVFGIADKVSKVMNVKIKELEASGYTYSYGNYYIGNDLVVNVNRSINKAISSAHSTAASIASSESSSGSGFGGGFSSGGGFGGGGGGGHGF